MSVFHSIQTWIWGAYTVDALSSKREKNRLSRLIRARSLGYLYGPPWFLSRFLPLLLWCPSWLVHHLRFLFSWWDAHPIQEIKAPLDSTWWVKIVSTSGLWVICLPRQANLLRSSVKCLTLGFAIFTVENNSFKLLINLSASKFSLSLKLT